MSELDIPHRKLAPGKLVIASHNLGKVAEIKALLAPYGVEPVSAATLVLTRPLAQRYVNSRVQPTNADALIGRDCVVTEDIDNLAGTGAVKIGGKVWTARTEDENEKYAQGDVVKAVRIEGVKLIVRK